MSTTPVLRLAPTPSGYLHLGNAVNFAATALVAERIGGTLLLRVDDLDHARVRGAYLNDVEEALHWLLPDRAARLWTTATYQSQRLARYGEVLAGLRAAGLVFGCACTRRQIREAQAAAGGRATDVNAYPGTCRGRDLPLDAPGVAWRLDVPPAGAAATGTGDGGVSPFVVRQRDGRPAYQLASVVDDVDLGVTHVVRGEDLRASTAMQLVLAEAYPPLGDFAAVTFTHHGLISAPGGGKLSKSDGATSLRALAGRGLTPGEVFRIAERTLGS